MSPLSIAELLLAFAAAMAAGRFIQLDLSKRQPALLLYLAFIAFDLLTLGILDPRTSVYFRAYLCGNILSWFVSIFAVREAFSLTFESYPGIRTTGQRAIYWATGISVAFTFAITLYLTRGSTHGNRLQYLVLILDRSIVFTLAAVVIAVLVSLSHYPLHLGRNTLVSARIFSMVFLSEAIMTLSDSLSAYLFSVWVDIAQVIFAASCFVVWTFLLRPEPVSQRVVFNDPRESELLQQLEAINQLLTRAGRR